MGVRQTFYRDPICRSRALYTSTADFPSVTCFSSFSFHTSSPPSFLLHTLTLGAKKTRSHLVPLFRHDIPSTKPLKMGNCGSTKMNAAANGEQSLPNARTGPANAIPEEQMREMFPDYTTRPSLGPKQQPFDGRPKFNLQTQPEDLPSYERHTSVDVFRNITTAANNLSMCGIKSTFDVLGQRHFEVYIDSTYTLNPDTSSAILLTALYILGNAKAKDSNMTFYFTSYPNTKSPRLSEKKRGCIKALVKLWRTQNWSEAVQAIQNDQKLKELDFNNWLRVSNFKDSDPDEEKHLNLLNYTR